MEIIAEVEEAMDIDIDDEAATSIITVEDAINIFLKSSQWIIIIMHNFNYPYIFYIYKYICMYTNMSIYN